MKRPKNPELSRADVVNSLVTALQPIDYVHAFWEGGSIAWGRQDDLSDIDAYVLVDDGKLGQAFEIIEKTLQSLSPIQQTYVVRQPSPATSQKFYRLTRASEYLVLDICVLGNSATEKYLELEIHGKSVFYFNK